MVPSTYRVIRIECRLYIFPTLVDEGDQIVTQIIYEGAMIAVR